jgi:hypothetical protein
LAAMMAECSVYSMVDMSASTMADPTVERKVGYLVD